MRGALALALSYRRGELVSDLILSREQCVNALVAEGVAAKDQDARDASECIEGFMTVWTL